MNTTDMVVAGFGVLVIGLAYIFSRTGSNDEAPKEEQIENREAQNESYSGESVADGA